MLSDKPVGRRRAPNPNIPTKYVGMFPPVGTMFEYVPSSWEKDAESRRYIILDFLASHRNGENPALKVRALRSANGEEYVKNVLWIRYKDFEKDGCYRIISTPE